MPLFNLFKNCAYYWGFSAYISYFVNHPLYTPPPVTQTYAALAFAMLCQASNLYCHLILANLRPAGSKQYRIPSGFLFNYITCANYTTEIYGWVAFSVATQTLSTALFTLAGAAQMAQWALAKHTRLRKVRCGWVDCIVAHVALTDSCLMARRGVPSTRGGGSCCPFCFSGGISVTK